MTSARSRPQVVTARVRLTAAYGAMFTVFGGLLVGLIVGVMFFARATSESAGLRSTLPRSTAGAAEQIRAEAQALLYSRLLVAAGLAIAFMTLLALLTSWVVAGRVLAAVERTHAAQRQFTANASHELRGPIATQRTLLDVYADRSEDGANSRLLVQNLRTVLARQERLVDGLLELATSQHGVQRRQVVDLAGVVRHAWDRWRPHLEGFQVMADLEPSPVRGDPVLLDILVDNLVRNAVVHNVPGGWIAVRTGGGAISLANSGDRVPAERLTALRAPFRRGVRDRTSGTAGSGLGLAIVDAVAGAHSATLHLTALDDGGLRATVSFR